MNCFRFNVISIFLILWLSSPFLAKAQNNVRVVSDKAVIYSKPDSVSSFQIEVQKGDIYEVIEARNTWVQLQLFSGGSRYIHYSQVEITHNVGSTVPNPQMQNKLCTQTEKLRKMALQRSAEKYPNNLNKQGVYEQILFDRYMLRTFRKFGIPASNYSLLVSCVNDPLHREFLKPDSQN